MAIFTFIRYASLVYIVKWHPFFSEFRNVKNLISHFRQFLRWCLSPNLLTYSDTERALLGIADDGLVSMVWCKHGFQRQRSNFIGKAVLFQKLWSKKNLL